MTIRRACADLGWLLGIAGFLIGFWFLVFGARVNAPGARDLTGTGDTIKIVPAFGEAGFDVAAFCSDPATKVTKDLVNPPDGTFAATYTLDRTTKGVHEVVSVGVYRDASRQPSGTHYDSANVPTDAFVSKDALKCIMDWAGKR